MFSRALICTTLISFGVCSTSISFDYLKSICFGDKNNRNLHSASTETLTLHGWDDDLGSRGLADDLLQDEGKSIEHFMNNPVLFGMILNAFNPIVDIGFWQDELN